MRARNLKPGFFKNEDLAELSFAARLLFAGLWCMADRAGRLEDRPKRIKAELFPYEVLDVDPLLDELAAKEFIHRYGTDLPCIDIPAFLKHQNPHKNEKPSELPAYWDIAKLPEQYDASSEPLRLNPSSLNPSSLNDESLLPKLSTGGEDEERQASIEIIRKAKTMGKARAHA